MVELYKSTTRNNKKGYYVRMKFLHNRYGRQQQEDKKQKPLCYKYFKWLLWFSLSFYFISFIFTHKPTHITSLSKTTLSLSNFAIASDALFESTNTTALNKPMSDLFKNIKIYVYDLPSKYNTDWLTNERCSNHLFASEVAIHRALMNSDVRTLDPLKADFFFVPVYVSCNFSTVNGFPALGHAKPLLSSAVQIISSEFPFWNRSKGYDHVFVASHDYGACFHAMEDVAIAGGIPDFMKNSIILQTFGVEHNHPCQEVENIVIPPYVSPEKVESTLSLSSANVRRDIFAFFRGKMEVHPKNISGRFYSKRVRTVIWRKYNNDRRFYLKRHRFAGYQSEIVRSVFCLSPLGWAPWSPRLVESVALGCVPVIIADGIRLPFSSTVPWPEISLTVAEKDVGKLGEILNYVVSTNLSIIQRNLWDPDVRRALLFHNQMEKGDATWNIIAALSKKVSRNHKGSRLSSE